MTAYVFRATGSVVKFPGFLSVYEEAREEGEPKPEDEEGEGKVLPPLEAGEPLDLVKLLPEQHFTQPPPRYSEATLVRALEEYGIGRPSTYAPIISTIQQRNYVERVGKQLRPTELGFLVNDLLVEYFPEIVDVGFTAHMEEDLDLIASGERQWVPVLHDFYRPFSATLRQAEQTMPEIEIKPEPTGEKCELCGGDLVIKLGRFGKFIGCSNYPACRNRKPILVKTGAHCPECGSDIVEKTTRRKRIFYSCASYPACKFSVWKKPIPTSCPACGGLLTIAAKDTVQCIRCNEQFPLEQVEPVPVT
jgi:DNA topoisomerase-1